MTRRIRNSAKAIIFRNGKMLATKIKDKDDIFYIMPGGGQEAGETLEEAVQREVAEEFGFHVKANSLEFVIEGVTGESFHRVDLVFLCEYIKEIPNAKIIGDLNQIGFDWLPVENLINEPLYPSRLRKQIMNLYNGEKTIAYLGDESME
jgi:8-oxo-dGTP pyrophosphatase MutT (NUDIX family)